MNTALKELRELALQASRWKHPTMPEKWRCTKNYTDKTSGGLQVCIIDFLRFNGHQIEKINCTGRRIDNTKVVTDVIGNCHRIGSVKWMRTTGQKGTADLSSIINGKSVKWEIKIRDKQSPSQVEYQKQVEQAGGIYLIVRSFQEFLNYYNGIKD